METVENEYGFYSLASEFMEAAKILNNHTATKLKVDSVSLYLICHSAELFLKAYLFTYLGEESFLKNKYGHKLNKLIDAALENNLKVNLSTLHSISNVYQKKQLEYRQGKELKLASIDDLIIETEALSRKVFDVVSCNVNETYKS
jgi:hypothetical protein